MYKKTLLLKKLNCNIFNVFCSEDEKLSLTLKVTILLAWIKIKTVKPCQNYRTFLFFHCDCNGIAKLKT